VSITFAYPAALWGLAALPLLWLVTLISRTRFSVRQRLLQVTARSTLVALLAVALAQPVWSSRSSGLSVVYLVDISHSIAATALLDAATRIDDLNTQTRPETFRILAFGTHPEVLHDTAALRALAASEPGQGSDPFDRDGNGVTGRAAMILDVATGQRRVGRFGWKAQQATLLAFSGDAYRNEMGITNDLFPDELAFGITPEQMKLCDKIPDPEDQPDRRTRRRGIDNFEAFMKFLAPAGRGPIDDTVRAGEAVFGAVGCASCHVPSLQTGPSANAMFNRKVVPLFSDLLLHDIGTGDGIRQEAAGPQEFRTPALWGLRLRRPLMHDGTAATIEDAIVVHGGEAASARGRFLALTADQRAALLAFLKSL
jgi:hypothetical protein